MRLIHEHVTFRAVQLRRRAVGVLVAVGIVKLRDCHGSLYGLLAKHPVPLPQYGRHMCARDILVAVLVTGFVVGIADVGIVAHRVVELYHRVLRLPYVQLVEAFHVFLVLRLVQILGQPVRAHQLAPSVRGVAARVKAAQTGVVPLLQVAAVTLQFQPGDADIFQPAAKGE